MTMAVKTSLFILVLAFGGCMSDCGNETEHDTYLECSKTLQQYYVMNHGLIHIEPANLKDVCDGAEETSRCRRCLNKEENKKAINFLIKPLEHVCNNNYTKDFMQEVTDCQKKVVSTNLDKLQRCVMAHRSDNCNEAMNKGQCMWRLLKQICNDTQAEFQLELMEKAYSVYYSSCKFDDAKETLQEEIDRVDARKQNIVVGSCVSIFVVMIVVASAIYLVSTKAGHKQERLENQDNTF